MNEEIDKPTLASDYELTHGLEEGYGTAAQKEEEE